VVKDDSLTDVHLDLLVEHSRKLFAHAGVIQFDKPHVDTFLQSFSTAIITPSTNNHVIDESHQDREHQNTYKLDGHGEAVFYACVPLDVSVTDSRKGGHYPVEGRCVFKFSALFFPNSILSVVNPAALYHLTNGNKSTGDSMHDNEHSQQELHQVLPNLAVTLTCVREKELAETLNDLTGATEIHEPKYLEIVEPVGPIECEQRRPAGDYVDVE
jgi:hypothetical protein